MPICNMNISSRTIVIWGMIRHAPDAAAYSTLCNSLAHNMMLFHISFLGSINHLSGPEFLSLILWSRGGFKTSRGCVQMHLKVFATNLHLEMVKAIP